MPNRTLSDDDVQEILLATRNLKGAALKQVVQQFADFHGVHYKTVYARTRDNRKTRKTRSDKGRRKHDLLDNPALCGVAEFVTNQNLKTDLAIEVVRANREIFGEMPDLHPGTVQRYLTEFGLSRTQAKTTVRPHRNFEAEFPMQIFQYDDSGVKERWVDPKTLRVLRVPDTEVNKNHSNKRSDRVRLWKMAGVDDFSRFRVVRYVAAPSITSTHYINYLREVVCKYGLMHTLYTDNASVLTSKRIQRGAALVDKMFESSGGFRLLQHQPENPQATGKVERGHQIVAEFERLIGVRAEFGGVPTLDELNDFADWFCNDAQIGYNCRAHRTTGQQPRLRFLKNARPVRTITPEQFDAAFKSQELTLPLRADVSVVIDKVKYQLPRTDAMPFVHLAALGKVELSVITMDGADFFVVVAPNGDEFTVPRVEARIDVAGEFKTLPETKIEANRRIVKQSAKARKAQLKADGKTLVVPGFDTAKQTDNLATMPQRRERGDAAILDALTHNIRQAAEDALRLDYFAANDYLREREIFSTPPASSDIAWLKSLFAHSDTITESDLKTALANRNSQRTQQPQQQQKPARHLRVA